jgi:hypothetical protein
MGSGQSHECRMKARWRFVPALQGGRIRLVCFPRIASAAADSIRGYSRSLPPGEMRDFE